MLTTSTRGPAKGFSLVELMVTVSLLAILVFAVIPDIGAWMRSMQVRNQAESIQAGLQRAKNEAVRRNREVRFSLVALGDPSKMDNSCKPAVDAASWIISLDDPTAKCGAEVSEETAPKIIASNAAGAGQARVKIAATGGVNDAHTVIFDHYGRIKGHPLPVEFIDVSPGLAEDEARRLRIVLTSAGSIRMCDRGVKADGDPRKC